MRGALAPPALGIGADLSPVQVLSCAGVSCLQLVVPRGEPLGAVGNRAIGFLALRHAVLRLRGPTSGPLTASAHFFSEISRLRLARDRGRGAARTSVRPDFFFCLLILAFDLYRSWRRTFCPVFLSAVRAAAARCKLPLCPPPSPVPRSYDAHQGDHKGKRKRKEKK